MPRLAVVPLVVLALALAGCGTSKPVGAGHTFDTAAGDTRVLSHYRQTGARTAYDVTFPAGTRSITLRMDCVAPHTHGFIDVSVPAGSGGVPCGTKSNSGGFIRLSGTNTSGAVTVVVTAPKDAVWSVAVDVAGR